MSKAAKMERIKNPNNSNRKRAQEARLGITTKLKGVPKSEEHKAKLRIPKSEEHKKNLSLANIGKRISDETKAKISAKLEGRILKPRTPEHTAKIIESKRLARLKKQELKSQS